MCVLSLSLSFPEMPTLANFASVKISVVQASMMFRNTSID